MHAGGAPCRPEIDQHDLAAQVFRAEELASQGGEREVGGEVLASPSWIGDEFLVLPTSGLLPPRSMNSRSS